ncbi:hypothetical protein ACUUL3_01440 [Thiovibrio sp. JS02]
MLSKSERLRLVSADGFFGDWSGCFWGGAFFAPHFTTENYFSFPGLPRDGSWPLLLWCLFFYTQYVVNFNVGCWWGHGVVTPFFLDTFGADSL